MTKKNSKDNIWQIEAKWNQTYNGFDEDAIDKFMQIADGDMANLDKWITEELKKIDLEMKIETEMEMALLEITDNQVKDDDPCELANEMLKKITSN